MEAEVAEMVNVAHCLYGGSNVHEKTEETAEKPTLEKFALQTNSLVTLPSEQMDSYDPLCAWHQLRAAQVVFLQIPCSRAGRTARKT